MQVVQCMDYITFVIGFAAVLFGNSQGNSFCTDLNINNANTDQLRSIDSPLDGRPWVTLLWVTCSDIQLLKTCEGSLVDSEWVLTSASCLTCGSNATVVADIGLYHSNIRREMIQKRNVQRVGSDHVVLHPQYNPPYRHNDIALVHLTVHVNTTNVIRLAGCPPTDNTGHISKSFLSSGWGRTTNLSPLDPKILQDVQLYKWTREDCVASTNERIDGLFCVGVKELKTSPDELRQQSYINHDPCFVGYGSSLVTQVSRVVSGELKCEWQVCGVLSFGLYCDSAYPGYYTDICFYRTWLLNTMKQEQGYSIP